MKTEYGKLFSLNNHGRGTNKRRSPTEVINEYYKTQVKEETARKKPSGDKFILSGCGIWENAWLKGRNQIFFCLEDRFST